MRKAAVLILVAIVSLGCVIGAIGLAAEKVTVRFGTPMILPAVRQAILDAQAKFMKANPDIEFQIDDMGSSSGTEFFRARWATGDFPDFVRVKTTDLKEMIANEMIQPLPGELAAMTDPTVTPIIGGKNYFVCYVKGFCGWAYNMDAAAKAGFKEPPMTMKDWVKLCKKLKAQGLIPCSVGMKDAWQVDLPLLWMHANELFINNPNWGSDLRTGKVKCTDPAFVNILKRVNEDVYAYLPKGATANGWEQAKQLFFSGKAAMLTCGVWLAGDVEATKPAFKVGLMPLPGLSADHTHFDSYADQGWVLSSQTKGARLEAAVKWLKFFYSREIYQTILDAEGQFGAVKGCLDMGPAVKGEYAKAFVAAAKKVLDKVGTIAAYDHQASIDNLPVSGWLDVLARVGQQMATGDKNYKKHAETLQKALEEGLKAEAGK